MLNNIPSSEISIVPLPVMSAFLAIFRVSNVTSESQQPRLRFEEREGEGGLILHPQDTGERGGKRKQHQQVMLRSVLISRC